MSQQSIIKTAVLETLEKTLPKAEFDKTIENLSKMQNANTLAYLRDSYIQTLMHTEMLEKQVLSEVFDEYIADFGNELTGFSPQMLARQKDIGITIWTATIQKQLFGEFQFLFNLGYLNLIRHFEFSLSHNDRRMFIVKLHPMMLDLIEADEIKGGEILQLMAISNIPGQEFESSTLLTKMMAGITSEIAGIFMKIQFLDILGKYKNPQNN